MVAEDDQAGGGGHWPHPSTPPAHGRDSRPVLLTVPLAVGDCAAASVLTPHHLPVECRFSVTDNRELERYRAELNGGADFPPVADQLRPGRRIGG